MKTQPDPLYLFGCHLEWRNMRNVKAYYELMTALDDEDPDIRHLAESLLNRSADCRKGLARQLGD